MDLTTLLAGPVGGAIGLIGGLVQKWMGMKEKKADHAMKLAELEIVGKLDLQKADIMFRSTVEEKSGEAFKAAIEAQGALKPAGRVVSNIMVLFRPALTAYLLVSSTLMALWYQDARPELLEFIITSTFMMSSTALGYWFGQRTEEKFRVSPAFPNLPTKKQ